MSVRTLIAINGLAAATAFALAVNRFAADDPKMAGVCCLIAWAILILGGYIHLTQGRS